jgi:hypothetical protein
MIDRFISWLYTRRLYGPRCSEYESEMYSMRTMETP